MVKSRMQAAIAIIAAFSIASVSCADVSASAQDPLTWKARHYEKPGVDIETPAVLCEDREVPKALSIGIHEIPPAPGVLGDTMCRVSVRVERMPRKRFEDEAKLWLSTGPPDPEERKRREWIATFHEKIARSDTSAYAQYRYDIDCRNGDILRGEADVVHVYQNGVSIHESEDEAAVRRMFGSLKCVDPAP